MEIGAKIGSIIAAILLILGVLFTIGGFATVADTMEMSDLVSGTAILNLGLTLLAIAPIYWFLGHIYANMKVPQEQPQEQPKEQPKEQTPLESQKSADQDKQNQEF